MKLKVLWHEPSNMLAFADTSLGGLPLLLICDGEYQGINPFYSYPLSFLEYYGWIEIGEI